VTRVSAEAGKFDPMHQFTVEPIAKLFAAGGNEVWLTTSAVWMGAAAIILWLFMLGGMKRQLVPGRWQMAVEGFTGFVSSMMATNIGPEGRKYTPYVFSLFMFILFCNILLLRRAHPGQRPQRAADPGAPGAALQRAPARRSGGRHRGAGAGDRP